ncbi:MAG: alpha-galactosidase, partial [Aquihabitans sp.]
MIRVDIDAGATQLVLVTDDDGLLHQAGFGSGVVGEPLAFPPILYPVAYPTYGQEVNREHALRITHADGATTTRLRAVDATEEPVDGGVLHRIELVDRAAPVTVTLCLRTWPAYDLLEQWVEIDAEQPVTVHRAMAAGLAFGGQAPHLTHWGGGWAGEWTETTEPLTSGTKTVASSGAVRPSLMRPAVFLYAPDGPATETEGPVLAATLLWGGDVRVDAEVALHGLSRLLIGHQDVGSEVVVDHFESPHAAFVWSDHGIGPTSRALHRFAREQVLRDGTGIRATVVNTWEAVGFNLDQASLMAQVDRAAELGTELFLLDDGWFGTSYPRNDDTQGLGDWAVDRSKLPDGLGPLIDHTLDRGLRFGLWVEPEMVNPRSELYEAHPDWVVHEPGRQRREERSQLALDLCIPEAREFTVDVITKVLADHPGISYLKWDANRDLTEAGTAAIERARATWDVMAEVARRHPDVGLMACASGGGRSDLGTLRYFHELWTSDNTDPVDRVRIQWGASHLLPASALGAHVTRWGQRPVAFGCAVAMSGRFGFDLDLTALDSDEWATCLQAVEDYHQIRDVVQQGDLYRLVSPVGSSHGAWAYLLGDRAIVFAFALDDTEMPPGPIELPFEVLDLTDRTPGRAGEVRPSIDGRTLLWPTAPSPSALV